MVRSVLALAVVLASTGAEVPTCQQDETTLLQGAMGVRDVLSLQPPSNPDEPPSNPDEVVEWAIENRTRAQGWVANNTDDYNRWAARYPDGTEEIYDAWNLFSAQSLTLLEDTKCLDGTRAGYYSDLNEDSDVWVIFLQGGGKCYDAATCGDRAGGGRKLGSSRSWRDSDRTGAMDARCNRNPYFCEANQVYIPYCSGDSHAGTRADQHEGLYVSGHLNFLAIIESLMERHNLGSASRVLLTGQSAGGGGVLNNADFLAGMLPNVIVKAAPIAAWFPDSTEDQDQSWMPVSFLPNFTAGVPSGSEEVEETWSAIQDWNLQDRGNCPTSEATLEGLTCSNTRTKASYVQTPLFISQNLFDSHQFRNVFNVTTDTALWSGDIGEWVAYYARSVQASTRLVSESPGNGLFLSATIGHGGDVGLQHSSRLQPGTEIEGHSYFPILADWFYDLDELPHVLVDTCDSLQTCLARFEAHLHRCQQACGANQRCYQACTY